MNRARLLGVGTILILALTTVAQQATTSTDGHGASASGMPTVQQLLTLLTEKLSLTGDQQTKIKPILQKLNDATQRVLQGESMSRDERTDRAKSAHYKADRDVRVILNDDQKKKLDQLEQELHSGFHGD